MKIFVCEYVTGGGLYRERMSDSLAAEGALMRDALLRDLADIPEVEVIVTCDDRLALPMHTANIIPVNQKDDVHDIWSHCMDEADAVWLIAPESGRVLSGLSEMVLRHGKRLLGSSPAMIDLTANKYDTYSALSSAQAPTIASYRVNEWPSQIEGEWVIKPDDGVGCEGVHYFPSTPSLQEWLPKHANDGLMVQPYVPGVAASLSMICRDGHAWLLACNQQKVSIEAGRFHYSGSMVNALADDWDNFDNLARKLAASLPGLSGYVGVDVISNDQGLHIVEINPRLTTSYVGLRQSIGCNPARLILDLLYNEAFDEAGFKMPEHLSRQVIEVTP
jgi:predicted ATP-grasp superfamily ATP-dependent carboligase